jgi:hypothetical protein
MDSVPSCDVVGHFCGYEWRICDILAAARSSLRTETRGSLTCTADRQHEYQNLPGLLVESFRLGMQSTLTAMLP